jgi:hypothetical protein
VATVLLACRIRADGVLPTCTLTIEYIFFFVQDKEAMLLLGNMQYGNRLLNLIIPWSEGASDANWNSKPAMPSDSFQREMLTRRS